MGASPKAIRVNKTTGTGVEIDWVDGHQSVYKFQYLRDACPCATCDDEREAEGRDFGVPPKGKPGALPMFRDPARPTEISPVGNYAINFHWNDGHTSGIYSWDFLRLICPCEECKQKRDGKKLKAGDAGAISQ
jgi:DUF971 family protein